MENPIKMDDLEVPQFSETSIYSWRIDVTGTYIYLPAWMGGVYGIDV